MKKISLLLLSAGAFLSMHAQNAVNPFQKMLPDHPKMVQQDNATTPATSTSNKKKTRDIFLPNPAGLGTKEWVGKTTYDLQTNGSLQRRVLQGAGGAVSCSWTFSAETGVTSTSGFLDRGTGYAHFNGTSWTPAPTAAIENPYLRTGFGGIVLDGSGNENYICHDANANQLSINKKSGTTWTRSQLTTNTTNAPIWPHTATAGNWMYIVASPSDSNNHTNGIRNGYYFARSNDNGATWIDNMIPFPASLIDSVGHYRGGGNSYAISANGSYVSVLFGDEGTDLTLLTSSDNGANWTKHVVFDFPIDNYNYFSTGISDTNGDNVADTLFTHDGSHSLVVDAAGVSHVSFSRFLILRDGTSNSWFPLSSELCYYNTANNAIVTLDRMNLLIHDCDGDNAITFGENYSTGDLDAAYRSFSLISQSSISIVPGSPQKVIIAYTAVMDGDTTVDDGTHSFWFGASSLTGQPYRDIFVVGSDDNGTSWNYFPVNVSKTSHFEEAFVSTPEIISGSKFPLLYQGDIEPGTILTNKDQEDPTFENFMICQQINVADVFTLGADSASMCNQSEVPLGTKDVINGLVGLVNVYPNPSTDNINVSMKFINTAKNVSIDIIDITGKTVYSAQMNNVTEDSKKISIASLSNGTYLVKVTTENGVITRKFVKD